MAMMVVMMIPAIVAIVIAVRAVMMMMPPTVMVMTIMADIFAGSPRMSAMGQNRKSRQVHSTSASPPITDMN